MIDDLYRENKALLDYALRQMFMGVPYIRQYAVAVGAKSQEEVKPETVREIEAVMTKLTRTYERWNPPSQASVHDFCCECLSIYMHPVGTVSP